MTELNEGNFIPFPFKANKPETFTFELQRSGPTAIGIYQNGRTSDTARFTVECGGKTKTATWRGFLGSFAVALKAGENSVTITCDEANSADVLFRPLKSMPGSLKQK